MIFANSKIQKAKYCKVIALKGKIEWIFDLQKPKKKDQEINDTQTGINSRLSSNEKLSLQFN